MDLEAELVDLGIQDRWSACGRATSRPAHDEWLCLFFQGYWTTLRNWSASLRDLDRPRKNANPIASDPIPRTKCAEHYCRSEGDGLRDGSPFSPVVNTVHIFTYPAPAARGPACSRGPSGRIRWR